MGGGWVLDFARLKLTQPSLAGAGAELGNNPKSNDYLKHEDNLKLQVTAKMKIPAQLPQKNT